MKIYRPSNLLSRALRPSWRYLVVMGAALLAPVLFSAACLVYLDKRGRLVAPAFTGNEAFDEKIRFVRERGTAACDVLAIGSSMAQNSIASEPLIARLPPGTSYLNAGFLGAKMTDTQRVLDFYLARAHPRVVVLVCGAMDFVGDVSETAPFDAGDVDHYLRGGSRWWATCKSGDPLYYLNASRLIARRRASRADYWSVKFDRGGAVPLEMHYPAVDDRRWNTMWRTEVSEKQYAALAAIVAMLAQRHIQLVCVQPPVRAAALDEAQLVAAAQRHWQRVDELLARGGAGGATTRLLNLEREMPLSDPYFADYSHVNADGARLCGEALGRRVAEVLAAQANQ
jgi:hypothetical protein